MTAILYAYQQITSLECLSSCSKSCSNCIRCPLKCLKCECCQTCCCQCCIRCCQKAKGKLLGLRLQQRGQQMKADRLFIQQRIRKVIVLSLFQLGLYYLVQVLHFTSQISSNAEFWIRVGVEALIVDLLLSIKRKLSSSIIKNNAFNILVQRLVEHEKTKHKQQQVEAIKKACNRFQEGRQQYIKLLYKIILGTVISGYHYSQFGNQMEAINMTIILLIILRASVNYCVKNIEDFLEDLHKQELIILNDEPALDEQQYQQDLDQPSADAIKKSPTAMIA